MKTFKEFVATVDALLEGNEETVIERVHALNKKDLWSVLLGEDCLNLVKLNQFQAETQMMENITAKAKLANLSFKAYSYTSKNPDFKKLVNIINGVLDMKNVQTQNGYVGIGEADVESLAYSKIAGNVNHVKTKASEMYTNIRDKFAKQIQAVDATNQLSEEYADQKIAAREAKAKGPVNNSYGTFDEQVATAPVPRA